MIFDPRQWAVLLLPAVLWRAETGRSGRVRALAL
jgi:hypothetical protein